MIEYGGPPIGRPFEDCIIMGRQNPSGRHRSCCRLMESLAASQPLPVLYPYLPAAQQVASSSSQRGTLREFALLALCFPRAYHPDAAAQLRLETLRTWTFIQFIRSAI